MKGLFDGRLCDAIEPITGLARRYVLMGQDYQLPRGTII
jgi:hypothetical protein